MGEGEVCFGRRPSRVCHGVVSRGYLYGRVRLCELEKLVPWDYSRARSFQSHGFPEIMVGPLPCAEVRGICLWRSCAENLHSHGGGLTVASSAGKRLCCANPDRTRNSCSSHSGIRSGRVAVK